MRRMHTSLVECARVVVEWRLSPANSWLNFRTGDACAGQQSQLCTCALVLWLSPTPRLQARWLVPGAAWARGRRADAAQTEFAWEGRRGAPAELGVSSGWSS
jgi:hypothetical protein